MRRELDSAGDSSLVEYTKGDRVLGTDGDRADDLEAELLALNRGQPNEAKHKALMDSLSVQDMIAWGIFNVYTCCRRAADKSLSLTWETELRKSPVPSTGCGSVWFEANCVSKGDNGDSFEFSPKHSLTEKEKHTCHMCDKCFVHGQCPYWYSNMETVSGEVFKAGLSVNKKIIEDYPNGDLWAKDHPVSGYELDSVVEEGAEKAMETYGYSNEDDFSLEELTLLQKMIIPICILVIFSAGAICYHQKMQQKLEDDIGTETEAEDELLAEDIII